MSGHFCVSDEFEVAALDLETVPEAEAGRVDSEFKGGNSIEKKCHPKMPPINATRKCHR